MKSEEVEPVQDMPRMMTGMMSIPQSPKSDRQSPTSSHGKRHLDGIQAARNFLFYLGGKTFQPWMPLDGSSDEEGDSAIMEDSTSMSLQDATLDNLQSIPEYDEALHDIPQSSLQRAHSTGSIDRRKLLKKHPIFILQGKEASILRYVPQQHSRRIYLERLQRSIPFKYADLENDDLYATPLDVAKSMNVKHLQSKDGPPPPPPDAPSSTIPSSPISAIPSTMNSPSILKRKSPIIFDDEDRIGDEVPPNSASSKVSFNMDTPENTSSGILITPRSSKQGFPSFLSTLPGQHSPHSSIRLSSRHGLGSASSRQSGLTNSRGTNIMTQLEESEAVLQGMEGNIRRRKQYTPKSSTSTSSTIPMNLTTSIDEGSELIEVDLPKVDESTINSDQLLDADPLHASFRQYTFSLDKDILQMIKQEHIKHRLQQQILLKNRTNPSSSSSLMFGHKKVHLLHKKDQSSSSSSKHVPKRRFQSLQDSNQHHHDDRDNDFEEWQIQILQWLHQSIQENIKSDPLYHSSKIDHHIPEIGINVHPRGSIFHLFPDSTSSSMTESGSIKPKDVLEFKDIEVFSTNKEKHQTFHEIDHFSSWIDDISPSTNTMLKESITTSKKSDLSTTFIPPNIVETLSQSKKVGKDSSPSRLQAAETSSNEGAAIAKSPDGSLPTTTARTEASIASMLSSQYHSSMYEYLNQHRKLSMNQKQLHPPTEPKPSAMFTSPRRMKGQAASHIHYPSPQLSDLDEVSRISSRSTLQSNSQAHPKPSQVKEQAPSLSLPTRSTKPLQFAPLPQTTPITTAPTPSLSLEEKLDAILSQTEQFYHHT